MSRKGFTGRLFKFGLKSMGRNRRGKDQYGRDTRGEYDLEDLADVFSLLPRFNEAGWEEDYTDIIDSAQDFAGNPGQYTILTDYFPEPAKRYCKYAEEEYNPEEFVREVKDDLGDDKYYAINLIIDEVADLLQEAWDVNYYNDNFLEGLGFSGAQPVFEYGSSKLTKNRIYGSTGAAYAAYSAAATRNGFALGATGGQKAANRSMRVQNLIRLTGTYRNTKATTFDKSSITNTPGYMSYKSAMNANRISGQSRRNNLIKRFGSGPTRAWKP
jgi:hypothetical protein